MARFSRFSKIKNFRLNRHKGSVDGEKKPFNRRITIIQKRTKHFAKATRGRITSGTAKYLKKYSFNIVNILVKLGFAKYTPKAKVAFIILPLILSTLVDNVAVAIVVTSLNLFVCVILFSFAVVPKEYGVVNGVFDYGKYKYIKSKREVIIMLIMTAFMLFSIIFGHYIFDNIFDLIRR